MAVGAAVMFGLVMALLAGVFARSRMLARIPERSWLAWGGLVLPGVTLPLLLVGALATGERLLADPQDRDVVQVRAVGRQWEWRFGALDGPLAPGRLIIPAGRTVHLHVTSEDVIHSFWVPRLAGKIDAIPGHVNVIRLVAPASGVYHGACAEFCGVGHAAMPFTVEVVADIPASGDPNNRGGSR
jgi:cytochrome c oxidase subunit 2